MRGIIAVGLVLLAAGAARADAKLEVTSAPVTSDVVVGADIEVAVTVKNVGDEAELTELTFDERSVSFEISVDGGRIGRDTQFHVENPTSPMEPDPLTPLKRSKLKAGESWHGTFKIPAIASGSWSIVTVYAGATPVVRSLKAVGDPTKLVKQKDAPRTVKVLPGPGGETEAVAKMTTNMGTITFRFYPKDALGSALNFVRIAQSGFYDKKSFHRIDTSLGVIQGGATQADGGGHFPYSIPAETTLKHKVLALAMARSNDLNSAGSQFYICIKPCTQLDGNYSVFGQVVEGQDVVDTLAAVKTLGPAAREASQRPKMKLTIESVKIQPAAFPKQ
jgi:peptidyl-prolyl cis-trans isomerase B (cyclophilin B)